MDVDKTVPAVLDQKKREWFETLKSDKPVKETFVLGPEKVFVLLKPYDVDNPGSLHDEVDAFVDKIAELHRRVTGFPLSAPIPIEPALSWEYRHFYGSAYLLSQGSGTCSGQCGVVNVAKAAKGLPSAILLST